MEERYEFLEKRNNAVKNASREAYYDIYQEWPSEEELEENWRNDWPYHTANMTQEERRSFLDKMTEGVEKHSSKYLYSQQFFTYFIERIKGLPLPTIGEELDWWGHHEYFGVRQLNTAVDYTYAAEIIVDYLAGNQDINQQHRLRLEKAQLWLEKHANEHAAAEQEVNQFKLVSVDELYSVTFPKQFYDAILRLSTEKMLHALEQEYRLRLSVAGCQELIEIIKDRAVGIMQDVRIQKVLDWINHRLAIVSDTRKRIPLRIKGTTQTKEFTPAHAERVLAMPNPSWELAEGDISSIIPQGVSLPNDEVESAKAIQQDLATENDPEEDNFYRDFYDGLTGDYKDQPDKLNWLLGKDGLSLYYKPVNKPAPGQKSEEWAALFWALKEAGCLVKRMSPVTAERLIKATFPEAKVSISAIQRMRKKILSKPAFETWENYAQYYNQAAKLLGIKLD
ncbi:hypothetical protein [Hymenobacter crusticola]|uniref:Uncharacterized protein n=1 Tax=Hymenobacter crusticola TaxID=1770526 RepID=A0A2C9ZUX4_9BACT|nr:hypothetical protein [Hymenobacter crusticola]OUJ68030.1 hypothetical protein BXP70_28180 [Hymenobacter crusticola]